MPPMTLEVQACKSLSATRTECCRCNSPPSSPPPPLPSSSSFHSLIIPITTSMMSLPHAAAPPVRHPPFNRREIRHVLGGHAPSLTCAAYVMCVITIASRSCLPSTLLSFSTVCACIHPHPLPPRRRRLMPSVAAPGTLECCCAWRRASRL